MVKIKKLIIPLIISFSLCACANNSNNSDIVETGGGGFMECFSPIVRISSKAKKIQDKNDIDITVSVGHEHFFAEEWKNNVYGTNLGYGDFALVREVHSLDRTVINQKFIIIEDFLLDKYGFQVIYDESTEYRYKYEVIYDYSFVDDVEVDDIDTLEKGLITYTMCIVDNNEVVSEKVWHGFTISSLFFKIQKETCSFHLFESEVL